MLFIPFRDILRECGPLVRLAMPLALAMLGGIAINTTDLLMLGWLGPEALAATALALSVFHPFDAPRRWRRFGGNAAGS